MSMTVKERVARWALKTISVDPDLLYSAAGDVSWANNYYALSREGYEACATVYRCINLISNTAGRVLFGVFEETEEGPELVPRHPFIVKLKRPNPLMGRAGFIGNILNGLLLGGRAFVWANKISDGEVRELWPIPPGDVNIIRGQTFGTIAGYQWSYNGQIMNLPPEDVLYLWFPHPRGDLIEHISPLKAAALEVDLSNEALQWNLSLLLNYAKPPFYVHLDTKSEFLMNDDHVKQIKRSLREEYSGSKNAGHAPVFKIPGLMLDSFGWSPQDMDWLKGLEKADIRIANVYSVPPELVGAQKTYENYSVAQKVLYTDAVLPLLDYISDELTNWDLVGLEPDEFVGVRRERIEILQQDQQAIAKWTGDSVDRGIITRNEARIELKYPKSDDPWADELTVNKEVASLATTPANIGTEDATE